MTSIESWQIAEAFDDIILGRGVKRSIHDLTYNNQLYVQLFIERLQIYKFFPHSVKDINIEVGFRIPAFLIKNHQAIFGHLFWEVFSEKRKRKIWGSVIRNEKGDWKYILPGNSETIVFVNQSRPEHIDIYHLT